jgi:hypothetical protein
MAEHNPGDWYGVVSAAGIALLPASVPAQTVLRVWGDLRQGRGIGAVIDGLVGAFGTSLSQLPHFAVMFTEADGGARVAVRGPIEARLFVTGDTEPRVVSGLGVTTWNERTLADASSGELSVPGAGDGPPLPISEGVVRAGRVAYLFADPAAMLPIAAGGTTEEPDVDVLVSDDLAAASTAAAEVVASAATPGPVPEPATASEPAPTQAEELAAEADEFESELGDPPAENAGEPSRTAETMMTEAVPTEYDQLLFGETVLSSVESAAVRSAEADGEAEAHKPTSQSISPASPESPDVPSAFQAPATVAPTAAASGLISAVPLRGSVPAVPMSVPESSWDDHDGQTVLVDQLPAVPAHRSDPSATPVLRTPPFLIMAGRAPLQLDRSAIVGTRPKLSRVQGGNVPHLVTVESPNSEISRSHVELRVEGADVLAVDLNSTNGTMLLRVGSDPVRLQPREAHLLVQGDRLDLGDGVVLTFEGLA